MRFKQRGAATKCAATKCAATKCAATKRSAAKAHMSFRGCVRYAACTVWINCCNFAVDMWPPKSHTLPIDVDSLEISDISDSRPEQTCPQD